MDKNLPRSIFDEAGKSKKSLPAKKAEYSPPSPPPSAVSKQILSECDIKFMFDKMTEMRKDLDKKADELKQAIALSRADVTQFFNDPKNFTPSQWEIIQQSRSELEKRVWAVVGKDPKKVKEQLTQEKEKKQRHGKTLGSRKNWIPLR